MHMYCIMSGCHFLGALAPDPHSNHIKAYFNRHQPYNCEAVTTGSGQDTRRNKCKM